MQSAKVCSLLLCSFVPYLIVAEKYPRAMLGGIF